MSTIQVKIIHYRDYELGFHAELAPMRIPDHHIFTLGVIKANYIRVSKFKDPESPDQADYQGLLTEKKNRSAAFYRFLNSTAYKMFV